MQNSPNQPNQNPNQSVIDRGNLRNCLKTPVLSKLTMEQGNLWSRTAQVHTQWKNHLLLKKIVTLRHSTRITSSTLQSTRRTSTSTFQDYHIQQWNDHTASKFKIWFRRSRVTLSDKHFNLQQHQQFQSFQQRITRRHWNNWKHRTVRNSRRGTEITAQNMLDVLECWHRPLHVWTLVGKWYNWKEVHLVRVGSFLHPELLHQEGPATQSQIREEKRLQNST